jgi:hypothetical protein
MNHLVACLEQEFTQLHARSCALVEIIPAEKLYWQPRKSSGPLPVYSCGEHLLRSAGLVEQTFGGLTANLWDDPFEWTLPETLSTPERVVEYLHEVEATRQRGFALITDDHDLSKEIATPSGRQTLCALLLDALARASHQQGRAFAIFRLFSDRRVPLL